MHPIRFPTSLTDWLPTQTLYCCCTLRSNAGQPTRNLNQVVSRIILFEKTKKNKQTKFFLNSCRIDPPFVAMRFPSSRVVCSSGQQRRRIPCGIFWSYQHSHVSTPRGGGWWWWRAGWVRKRVAERGILYTGDYNIFGCGNKREKRTQEKEKNRKKNNLNTRATKRGRWNREEGGDKKKKKKLKQAEKLPVKLPVAPPAAMSP